MIVILIGVLLGSTLLAQGDEAADLRDRLLVRYDILALQDGVALVPRRPDADIRIIQVRDGGVAVNGETLTGRELRARLGADADLVLRVTYLDAAGLRALAGTASTATPPPLPPTIPDVRPPDLPEPPLRDIPSPRRVRRGGDTVRI